MPGVVLLHRDLDHPLPPPRWPEGIAPRAFSAAEASTCHSLLRRAYAQGGGTVPAGFDGWWQATRDDPEFDAGLVFLAATGDGALVGLALCWTSSFVKDLVVHPDCRRRGIGEALLLTAFAAMRARGHRRIRLKLQMDNPTGARWLYERLGFSPA